MLAIARYHCCYAIMYYIIFLEINPLKGRSQTNFAEIQFPGYHCTFNFADDKKTDVSIIRLGLPRTKKSFLK